MFAVLSKSSCLYVASLYGRPNADSTDLFREAATAAARVGQAPYFICMDANIDIDKHPYLLQMLQKGWSNVADGFPDFTAPTFATNKDWDRVSRCSGATRIDYVLANPAARSLVTDFALMRDLGTKQHLGLQVTLDLHHMDQTAARFQGPTAYQPTPRGICPTKNSTLSGSR